MELTMKRIAQCILLLLCSVGYSTAGSVPVDFTTGWPVLDKPDEPPFEVTVTTEEIWRLDCGEDAEPLVGRLEHAAVGQEGRLYLADSQLGRVLEISASGKVEAVRGRMGEGPGEFKGVYRMVALPDGRLGAVGGATAPGIRVGTRGELVLVDGNDDPAGAWMLGGDPGTVPTTNVRDVRPAGNRLLVVSTHTEFSPPKSSDVRELSLSVAPDGARTVLARRLWTKAIGDVSFHERDQFEVYSYGRCDLASDGRIALALERDRWLVAVGEPDGGGEIWERSLAGVRRTEDELMAARKEQGVEDIGQICDSHPLVRRVRWRPDGRLWVEPWGVEPRAGCVACFDEFSTDGRLLRRVHLSVDGQLEHGRLQILSDGRFVWFEGFERRDNGFTGTPRVSLLQVVDQSNRGL
jgi:hypothetical protein